MYSQKNKTKENQTLANSAKQKKNNVLQAFGFVDNRSETAIQRNKNTGNGVGLIDNRSETIIQRKTGGNSNGGVIQFWPRPIGRGEALALIKEVMEAKDMTYSYSKAEPYLSRILYESEPVLGEDEPERAGWGSEESIKIYLKNIITDEVITDDEDDGSDDELVEEPTFPKLHIAHHVYRSRRFNIGWSILQELNDGIGVSTDGAVPIDGVTSHFRQGSIGVSFYYSGGDCYIIDIGKKHSGANTYDWDKGGSNRYTSTFTPRSYTQH